jgi:ParB-like chromosome segregation protein Spo0J
MRFHSQLSTNALQRLEWLTTSLSTATLSRLATAQSLNASDNILSDLRRYIVDDGLGMSASSDEELVFRTARMILDTQLRDLEQAIHRILAADQPSSVKPDMWRGFLNALPLAKAELWRVTRIWLPYRRGSRPSATRATPQRTSSRFAARSRSSTRWTTFRKSSVCSTAGSPPRGGRTW